MIPDEKLHFIFGNAKKVLRDLETQIAASPTYPYNLFATLAVYSEAAGKVYDEIRRRGAIIRNSAN